MLNKTLVYEQAISELLLESNPLDYGRNAYLELLVQPTFTAHFFLQITWDNQLGHWYRSTWQSELDRAKNLHWFDKKNPENNHLSLSILQEKGIVNSLIIKELLDKILKLSISPSFENVRGGRDGEQVRLVIGSPFMHLSYAWATASLPEAWSALDEIYQLLLSLNQTLQSSSQQLFTSNWYLEENQNSWEKYLSFEARKP
jgi:hypothetical protein